MKKVGEQMSNCERLTEVGNCLDCLPCKPCDIKSIIQEAARKASNPKDAVASTRIPLWLLSPIAKAHWALAQFAGAVKYGAWNWRVVGVRSSVYLSAAQRHLDAYSAGEELDPVDGTHHLGNLMACCAILLDASAAGQLTDDRPPSLSLRPTYRELEELAKKLMEKYAEVAPRHYTCEDTPESKPTEREAPNGR